MTDTVESVLAEMRATGHGWWADRLAAAHEREVGALRNEVAQRIAEILRQQSERLAAHCRAEAAEALLREVVAADEIGCDDRNMLPMELRFKIDARLSATPEAK